MFDTGKVLNIRKMIILALVVFLGVTFIAPLATADVSSGWAYNVADGDHVGSCVGGSYYQQYGNNHMDYYQKSCHFSLNFLLFC